MLGLIAGYAQRADMIHIQEYEANTALLKFPSACRPTHYQAAQYMSGTDAQIVDDRPSAVLFFGTKVCIKGLY